MDGERQREGSERWNGLEREQEGRSMRGSRGPSEAVAVGTRVLWPQGPPGHEVLGGGVSCSNGRPSGLSGGRKGTKADFRAVGEAHCVHSFIQQTPLGTHAGPPTGCGSCCTRWGRGAEAPVTVSAAVAVGGWSSGKLPSPGPCVQVGGGVGGGKLVGRWHSHAVWAPLPSWALREGLGRPPCGLHAGTGAGRAGSQSRRVPGAREGPRGGSRVWPQSPGRAALGRTRV